MALVRGSERNFVQSYHILEYIYSYHGEKSWLNAETLKFPSLRFLHPAILLYQFAIDSKAGSSCVVHSGETYHL